MQYGHYLERHRDRRIRFSRCDYRYHRDAMGLILDRLPVATLQLAVRRDGDRAGARHRRSASLAALRVNRFADRVVSVFALLSQSMPSFWIGIVFILVFARQLNWLASGGARRLDRLILPGPTLALPVIAILIRADPQRPARRRARELHPDRPGQGAGRSGWCIFPHAIRNALIPIVTVAGHRVRQTARRRGHRRDGLLLAGRRAPAQSTPSRPATTTSSRPPSCSITAGFVAINLIVDVLYGYLDPRIRLGR